ncbi:protein of unknown function [Bartonella clarridgeiae 73]|uniref:Uncharacterized protein n=1 Tax=Bartonella clarridgeiae (strain CCUG 45776 / CIP 104772 / 73) TaxID=696125 RepID=E6YHP9_BARC7|nr:hypothetical protein [Bartonella clarridgeiae]WCR55037.1 MAG: hypothetical protein PG977_000430 [Bartonella clarridgeiae]CBI76387.1 protein of unknown function [Bartonella clarridgeiae 73]
MITPPLVLVALIHCAGLEYNSSLLRNHKRFFLVTFVSLHFLQEMQGCVPFLQREICEAINFSEA